MASIKAAGRTAKRNAPRSATEVGAKKLSGERATFKDKGVGVERC